MTPIIDGHLDLAWNAVGFERDLTLSIDEINLAEQGCRDNAGRGRGVVSLAEMRRGRIHLCFATLLSRAKPSLPIPPDGAKRISLDHRSAEIAHCDAHSQLAWYELMARRGVMRLVRTAAELEAHWRESLASPESASIGMILVMEGADPVTAPSELEYWFDRGLRQINLVHYGMNRYAAGTGAEGGITTDGRALLRECSRLGVALDLTHLADEAFFQALDAYDGPVLASHQNCRALVPKQRQFSDEQIRLVIERDGVLGVALDSWMLLSGWIAGVTPREAVKLELAADHIDHICQLAGHHRAVAIGTDLDGGYGREQTPIDLDSIADVQQLTNILHGRGYGAEAIDAIFHGNWLCWLRRQLPAGEEGSAANAPPARPTHAVAASQSQFAT
jgi:membrane dipeptidase